MTEVLYAIADTHLGLREHGRDERHHDDPVVVADFLRWLARVGPKGQAIPWWDGREVGERVLRAPTRTLLLGDILELWDAENDAVLLSTASVAEALRDVPGEKVYVLGNHDNVLAGAAGAYPLGVPGLRVVEEVWPEPLGGHIEPLRLGPRAYLFVHGHQVDRFFRATRGGWRVLGHVRQFGAAMGAYAWVFLGLAAVAAALAATSPVGVALVLALLAMWFPRFYMTTGRRLWAGLAGRRYDRAGTLRGFAAWWRDEHRRVGPAEDLAVVFGHTHFLDWFDAADPEGGQPADPEERAAEEALATLWREQGRRRAALCSVSSWVSTTGPRRQVTRATLLYADAQGPVLLGWDWRAHRPFHIPMGFVRRRRLGQRLGAAEAKVAEQLGWPAKMLEQWQAPEAEL